MKVFNVIFYSLFILSISAWGEVQKTVCSITINSEDEIKEFKKAFSPKLWNFIELTELDQENDNENHFLSVACQRKINCDILLISGHFGGSFFGKSDKSLSLEDLENYSCDKDCSGILQNPKEVFLFGCNTLATKEKDHRTPEEYLSVLMSDGFSRAQANEVVAYRYSEYGSSTQSRMMNIFNHTPRIYGFSSVAPIGARVKSSLTNYLRESKGQYSNFDEMNRNLQNSKNQILFRELSSFSISQVAGSSVLNEKKHEKPYCFLQNTSNQRERKLSYIQNLVLSGQFLDSVPHIKNFFFKEFFEQRKDPSKKWSPSELEIINVIRENPTVLGNFRKLLELKGDIYFGIRTDIFQLMRLLRIISNEYYEERIISLLELDLTKKVERQKVDVICSGKITADISFDRIPAQRWKDREFIDLLGCLKPSDSKIHLKLTEIFGLNNELSRVSAEAIESIKHIGPDAQKKLIEHYRKAVDRWPKLQVLHLLVKLDADMDITQKLLIEALGDKNLERGDITSLIQKMGILPQNKVLVAQMIEKMTIEGSNQDIPFVWFYDYNYGTSKAGSYKTYAIKKAEEQRPFVNMLLNKKGINIQNFPFLILLTNLPLAKENIEILKSALEREDPKSELYKNISIILRN